MNEEQKWVDGIVLGLESSNRVSIDPLFVNKLEKLALKSVRIEGKITKSLIYSIAAGMAFLILANAYVFSSSNLNDTTLSQEISISEDYNLVPTKSLYHE